MLLIDNDTAAQVLNMAECITVLEEDYKEEALGSGTNRTKMLTAILRANSYIKSRAGDLPALMKRYMNLPSEDAARAAFEAYRGLWSENGLTSDEGLRNVAALGGVPDNTSLDKLADWSILKEALASQKTP